MQRGSGRRWVIEICGPQRPAEIALGPQFETTWERQRTDFAMMAAPMPALHAQADIR